MYYIRCKRTRAKILNSYSSSQHLNYKLQYTLYATLYRPICYVDSSIKFILQIVWRHEKKNIEFKL